MEVLNFCIYKIVGSGNILIIKSFENIKGNGRILDILAFTYTFGDDII